MTKTTSSEIINFLSNHKPATVMELSQQINVTKADIRHHLKFLIEQTKIIEVAPDTNFSRGRPARRFTMNPTQLPDNYVEIVELLFENTNQFETVINELYTALYKKLDIEPYFPLIRRLNLLIKALNERKYQARWESHALGPELIINNCPYRLLLEKYPDFCKIDLRLISEITNHPCIHIHSVLGYHNCKFRMDIDHTNNRIPPPD